MKVREDDLALVRVDRPAEGGPRKSALATLTGRALGATPPLALVLLGVLGTQVGAAVAKRLFSLAGPAGAVTLRLVFAAVVLLVLWRPSLRVSRRLLPAVLGFGTVLAAMNIAFYQSLERIPLGAAVTIEFLGPLAVSVLGSRRWLDGLWALLAGVGVVLLARVGGGLSLSGVLFALLAGACWAAYILLGALLGNRTSGGSGLALAMAWGALLALPFGVAVAGSALVLPSVLVTGLGVALLSSVVPYSLEFEALRRMPPRTFGVLLSLEPAVAALAGLVVLGESLVPAQWVAICCVVAASIGATRSARHAPGSDQPHS